ncbi:MAG: ABC transporter substrate-binding protein, partial [Ottowia sp.]|nr:ABC transporter substrate-binding protein [Ottowia sp.]
EEFKRILPAKGMELVEAAAPRTVDIPSAVRSLAGKVDVIYTNTDNNVVSAYESLAQAAGELKIPLVAADTDSVKRGAVAALGQDYRGIGRQTGRMVVRILAGEKPGAIPSETGKQLDLTINAKAAEAQGVTLSEDIIKEAKEVLR